MKRTAFATGLLVFWAGIVSQAQTITQIGQTGTVLMRFDSFNEQEVQPGSEYYALSNDGKKVAIIKLKKVKGNQAVGVVLKGKAQEGLKLVPRSVEGKTTGQSKLFHQRPGIPSAILLGFGSSSMALTAQYSSTGGVVDRSSDVTLTGTALNVKGLVEFPVSERIFIRGITGLEMFNVKGSGKDPASGLPICDSGTTADCKANFNYLAMEGSGHWAFMQSNKIRAHVGLGYSYLLTLSKDVNIPNLKASAATNQMVLFKLGIDFLAKKTFFPVTAEYGYIPGDNVKASALYIRAGYGFYF